MTTTGGPTGERFAGSGAAEWARTGHGDDFAPLTCPVKGDPRSCCTYSFFQRPCPEAQAIITLADQAAMPAPRRSWLARLLRWGR